MLTIVIPETELFDELTNQFTVIKQTSLQLEHSLVSLSKWESKYCKPFLTDKPKTDDESIEYIKCMTITQNVDPIVYRGITKRIMEQVIAYIQAPMTATTFSTDGNKAPNREIITSEIIYYWMIAYNIPVEFQKWHLNRLITLIQVCNVKNQPPKKMSKRDLYARNKNLNAARRQHLNTNG